jgi:conjugative transfer signal peptidase TraF
VIRKLLPFTGAPIAALLLFGGPAFVRLNLSPSLPRGIYRLVSEPAVPGSLVMVCLPEQTAVLALNRRYVDSGSYPTSCASRTRPLLKTLAAVAGDHVSSGPLGISVNGVLLPHSLPLRFDRRGRAQAAFVFRGVLPDARVWIHAPHPRSWDSRYFGPLPASSIAATLKPLLVLP